MEMRDLSADDWELYFRGVIFRHPTTGAPCRVAEINRGAPLRNGGYSTESIFYTQYNSTNPVESESYAFQQQGRIEGDSLNQMADTNFWMVPRLGYRVYDKGRLALYIDRIAGGAQRGLTKSKTNIAVDPVINSLFGSPNLRSYSGVGAIATMTFNPTNISLEEGMAKMRAGEQLCFCINEDVLVRPSSVGGTDAEMVFRNHNVIARILNDNSVVRVNSDYGDEMLSLTGVTSNADAA